MKSTFRTLFYLRANRVKNDGKAAIMVRITVNGDMTQFNTKVDIHPDLWDAKIGRAKGKTAEAANLNRLLDNIRGNISFHYNELINSKGYALPEQIKNALLGINKSESTLVTCFTQYNELCELRVGKTITQKTFTRYKLTLTRLVEFMKVQYNISDIPLSEIDTNFIERFYLYIRNGVDCNNNTSMKFVQRFRTVFEYAGNSSNTQLPNPFANFKFHFDVVHREILNQEEINRIYEKDFGSQRINQIRDVFIFSCYTGLSYIDISELTEANLRMAFDNNLWIMTKRQKTNVSSNVRLLDIPMEIIEKYKGKQKDGKLLPVVSNQKTNEYLKEIAEICRINKNLTFHIARHTFATTIGLSNGMSIETISKILGHTDIRTTQIYAKIVDKKVSDDMSALSEKLKKANGKSQNPVKFMIDERFECLSLDEKMELFGLPKSLTFDAEREKRIAYFFLTFGKYLGYTFQIFNLIEIACFVRHWRV